VTLAELVKAGSIAGQARVVGDPNVDVRGLAYDSRKAGPGTLFFCVVGEKRDGHEFAGQVVDAGAVALVVERELDVAVPQVVVPSARAAMAPFAAAFWGDPTAELQVIGVTGTNGKTTTAYLTREILEAAGIQTGLMGTVKQVVGGEVEPVERTTPEGIDLQETFRRMLEGGDRACAMEVSSHAMVLHRADAIHFDVAVFTNLTQDHLDFHADMEDYFAAKRMLFAASPGVRIVNVDDPYGRRLAAEFECLTFSAEGTDADYRATDVEFDAAGATFTVSIASRSADPASTSDPRLAGRKLKPGLSFRPTNNEVRLKTGMPGHFNVANALAAFATAEALGVDAASAAAGLAAAARVPGRFEPIDEGQGFAVLVDYAHTPDSIENVLRAARRLTAGRLISVFGAGGDRDRAKRPLMGRAGGLLSDLAIVTSDNPRSEDPEAIVAEVAAGAREGDAELIVEVDRHAAIALALDRAEPGDTVVIAGKGHEQGQEFEGGRKIPFDDREVAREELRKLGSPA
jgi:UDP-N-acetylmuramoyl-L-alanyl-D-glutamate--2,6-diaminopimelate ligase